MHGSLQRLFSDRQKAVSVLIVCDIAILFGPHLLLDMPNAVLLVGLAGHLGVGIWIGLLLRQGTEAGGAGRRGLTIYWVTLGLSVLTAGGLSLVQWLVAIIALARSDQACGEAGGEDRRPGNSQTAPPAAAGRKAVWPLYVALAVLAGALGFIVVMATSDMGEFRGLGMLVVGILLTPVFLAVPAVLRRFAADTVKPAVIGLQMTVYVSVVLYWAIFLARANHIVM